MNGRYYAAESPAERIAIATLAANRVYLQQHPHAQAPSKEFLTEFLESFVERELVNARLGELHYLSEKRIRARERELAINLQTLGKACEAKLG